MTKYKIMRDCKENMNTISTKHQLLEKIKKSYIAECAIGNCLWNKSHETSMEKKNFFFKTKKNRCSEKWLGF